MATIPVQATELRHVRKTIAFDGSAGNGAVGTVTVFATTGRVRIEGYPTVYCTEAIVDAGGGTPATLEIGVTGNAGLIDFNTPLDPADSLGVNQFWRIGNAAVQTGGAFNGYGDMFDIGANIILTIANEAITNGTIIVDLWYFPITDDGALAGDDIDEPLRDHIWAKALSDLAAVPAATASALAGLNWLFTLGRNRRKQTATTETVYKDDATTAAATSTKSDDGTTFERGEYS